MYGIAQHCSLQECFYCLSFGQVRCYRCCGRGKVEPSFVLFYHFWFSFKKRDASDLLFHSFAVRHVKEKDIRSAERMASKSARYLDPVLYILFFFHLCFLLFLLPSLPSLPTVLTFSYVASFLCEMGMLMSLSNARHATGALAAGGVGAPRALVMDRCFHLFDLLLEISERIYGADTLHSLSDAWAAQNLSSAHGTMVIKILTVVHVC